MEPTHTIRARITLALTIAVLLSVVGPASAQTPDPVLNLGFAAVNQSLWAPGPAAIFDNTISIPDPAFHASVTLDSTTIENPPAALLDYLTDALGVPNPLDAVASASIAPQATVDASLSASYHVNSGSLDVIYPTAIKLDLPDQIEAGHAFTVSAAFPSSTPLDTTLALNGPEVIAAGGGGYAEFQTSAGVEFKPGFTTTFPYATADVNLNLDVTAGLNAEACVLGQCVDGNIDIPSIDLGTNIAHASTLDGVSVLGAQVVGYGTYSLGAGATVTVNAPDKLAVDGTLQADKTLAGSSAEPLLSVAIGAEQFLPLVGQALHSEVGPFGYTLLSVSPEFSAGVYEHLTFDPHVNVTLHFSEPMLRPDGTIGNDVTFRAGDTISLTPASVGTLLGQVQVTPTFTLENTFHNDTGLFVDGRVNVEALKIDTPEIGPLISESIELGTVELPPLFSGSFGVNMGSITTDTIGLTRQGNAADLALATAAGLIDPEGFGFADIGFGRQGVENVHGRFFMGDLLDPNDLQEQQSYFLADEDVFNQFGLNLGRVFCVVCFDIASPLSANPLLAFDSGQDGLGSIYLSDLSTFPTIPTPAEVRATDPAFSPVPEPSTVLLLAAGLPLVAYGRRRQTRAGRAR